MTHPFVPSYDVYRSIIRDIQKSGKYCDYAEAPFREKFILMRHDIEFSIERAYHLSLIETQENFSSTYFVQITNNFYNAFSLQNMQLLRQMIQNGHHIGLHYHLNGQTDPLQVRDGVRDQIRILSEMLGTKVDRFSIHRPIKEVYYHKIDIPGIINAYAPDFFTYRDQVKDSDQLEVKYIADSKHRWNYGIPMGEDLLSSKKIQILTHPFSWTEAGYDNLNNFKSLLNEKNDDLIQTLDMEFQRFSEIKDIVKKEQQYYEVHTISMEEAK